MKSGQHYVFCMQCGGVSEFGDQHVCGPAQALPRRIWRAAMELKPSRKRRRAIEPHWVIILTNGDVSPFYTTHTTARTQAHHLKRFGIRPVAIVKVTPK